jgi:competence protein ComEA
VTDPLAPDPRRARLRIAAGAAVLLVLVALGAAVVAALLGPAGVTAIVDPTPSPTSSGATAGAGGAAGGGSGSSGGADPAGAAEAGDGAAIYIHVVGRVQAPGLYRLAPGARVVDAIAAAGGLTPEADAAAVNLARPVSDGEQLVVTAVGEAPPASAAGGGTGASGVAAPGAKVNLNTADQTALETLPRVGPALAQRIMAWREQNGRFSSIEDLRAVSGIGDRTFEQLAPLVTV